MDTVLAGGVGAQENAPEPMLKKTVQTTVAVAGQWLPLEVRDLFREWLMANYPDRYRHVFTLIRDMRNGRDYDSQWGTRMKGTGPMAWMIGRRFEIACEKLGLNKRRVKLTTDHFIKPKRSGQQLSLF